MDVSQYLEIFIDETKEHLQSLNEQLLVLEKEPENEGTINEIFRAAHSLKGMAGTMGYKRMQRLTHDMENVFSEIRAGKMKVKADLVDVLFRGLDALESYLDNIVNSADEGTEDNEEIINELNRILKAGLGDESEAPVKEEPKRAEVPAEIVKEFKLEDHENRAIAKIYEEGGIAYAITVYIQEACILKAARAFLVFKALEELGDVIKSNPDVQDIEDEKFDFDFSIVLLSKENEEKVREAILSVSEIKGACIKKIEAAEVPAEAPAEAPVEEKKVAESEEKKEQPTKPAQTKQAQAKQAQAGKPVVNRSVRVDINEPCQRVNHCKEWSCIHEPDRYR